MHIRADLYFQDPHRSPRCWFVALYPKNTYFAFMWILNFDGAMELPSVKWYYGPYKFVIIHPPVNLAALSGNIISDVSKKHTQCVNIASTTLPAVWSVFFPSPTNTIDEYRDKVSPKWRGTLPDPHTQQKTHFRYPIGVFDMAVFATRRRILSCANSSFLSPVAISLIVLNPP